MATKIDKWGNSLAVRLPGLVLKGAKLRRGTAVQVRVVDEGILISRVPTAVPPREPRKYKLADLLSRNKGPNPYKNIGGGPPVGKEIL